MNEKVVKHVYTNRGIPIQKDKYNDYYLFLKVVIDFANDTEIWILRERETDRGNSMKTSSSHKHTSKTNTFIELFPLKLN